MRALLVAVMFSTPIGAPIAAFITAPVVSADDQCGDGFEMSKTTGQCIPAPPGATFRCVDGDYSYSKTTRGACSRHGGVAAAVGQ